MIVVAGHRGAGFLEPENTLRAVRRGIGLGVGIIEVDVRVTCDRKAVVIHDETLDRTTNGTGKVSDFTLAELRELDAGKGEKIPTLDDVIAAAKGKAVLQLELKDDFLEEQVVEAVRNADARDGVVVISFSGERLRKVKKLDNLETGLICVRTENNIGLAKDAGASILMHSFRFISKEVIVECRKRGLKVGVWNPDSVEDIEAVISMNPDIISSNRPDLVISILNYRESHEELIDIVDESDNVVGSASWKEMMERNLLHRTANTMVFNSEGLLFVHRRPDHVRLYPGMWDVKFGGSVRAGESYEEAARRELFEEAGINVPALSLLFRLRSERKENNAHRAVFKCVYDGRVVLDPSEVSEGRFMSLESVRSLMAEGRLSPSAVDVLVEFLRRSG